jgi:hypothetical protein
LRLVFGRDGNNFGGFQFLAFPFHLETHGCGDTILPHSIQACGEAMHLYYHRESTFSSEPHDRLAPISWKLNDIRPMTDSETVKTLGNPCSVGDSPIDGSTQSSIDDAPLLDIQLIIGQPDKGQTR